MGQGKQLPNKWREIRDKIVVRDNGRCRNCASERGLEVHHIVPVSEGGTHNFGNLVTLCKDCHKSADEASQEGRDRRGDLSDQDDEHNLSPQQVEILKLKDEGLKNLEIAEELDTHAGAIGQQTTRIYNKEQKAINTLKIIDLHLG